MLKYAKVKSYIFLRANYNIVKLPLKLTEKSDFKNVVLHECKLKGKREKTDKSSSFLQKKKKITAFTFYDI